MAEGTVQRRTAVVIGGGIGGLAAAGRLRRAGFDVTLLEKNEHVGGRCDVIEERGHRFDVGPSIVLVPSAFEETFHALGERIEDHLDLVRVDPGYKVHFSDAKDPIELTSNLVAMQAQLEALEPGSFAMYLRYLEEGRTNLHETLRHIAHQNFYSLFQYFNPLKIPVLFRVKALKRHYSNIGNYFRHEKLKAAFTFQNMYIGLSPYEAPATFSLLQYTELCDGIWFPQGGLYKIISALEGVNRKLGVRQRCGAAVREIRVDPSSPSRVSGVVLDSGEVIEADLVVATADLPYVYKDLLPDKDLAKKVLGLKFSSSTISFFWATSKVFAQLGHHNMFVSSRKYRQSFDDIFVRNTLPDEPSFYVNCPSRTDPSAAPPGCDSLMVLVPVGHLSDEEGQQDWPALVKAARRAVLRRLAEADIGITDLEQSLKFERIVTPADWKSMYNVEKGSTFGLNHQFTQVGYLRPANKHPRYSNLYFAGCSTHPGSGLPNVLVSSRLTVARILEDLGLSSAPLTSSLPCRFPPVPAPLPPSSLLSRTTLLLILAVLALLVSLVLARGAA